MENNGTGEQLTRISDSISDDAEIERKLESALSGLRLLVDSPKALLIMRNAALTLLEVHGTVGPERMLLLVADPEFRAGVVNLLVRDTPKYWDETWNAVWHKDAEPLYSVRQQRIARRRSLIAFWTKEWSELPEEEVAHVGRILAALAS